MNRSMIGTIVFFLAWVALMAQQPGPDPLQRYLFPPELVMRNQETLRLSDQQQEAIIARVQQAQQQFTNFQWKLQREVQRLAALLQRARVDEDELLAQLEEVFALEIQIKKTHLLLVVGIKNLLTREQQELLQALKAESDSQPTKEKQK